MTSVDQAKEEEPKEKEKEENYNITQEITLTHSLSKIGFGYRIRTNQIYR